MSYLYFTNREKEVIRLLIEGFTNREISEKLFISIHTVKSILENLYDKTGYHSRVQLALYIVQNNIEIE